MIPCLSIRNLFIQREKNGTRFSLVVPELDIFRKQTLVILGASGCGKSTLLDMLALILRPTSVETFSFTSHTHTHSKTHTKTDLFTAPPSTLARLRRNSIGYVLQSGGLLPFLSVQDNILLPGRLAGVSEKTLSLQMKYLVETLDITAQLKKHPQHLSGGQRQRVAIARALTLHPPLVFADEPTAAVDQGTSKNICEIFKKLTHELDIALVIVSHDEKLMAPLADTLVNIAVQAPSEHHLAAHQSDMETDIHSLAQYSQSSQYRHKQEVVV